MEAAIDDWNSKTSDTKVAFVKKEYTDPFSAQKDIKFRQDDSWLMSQGSRCAGGTAGGDLRYEGYLATLGEDVNATIGGRNVVTAMTQIFAHELGHTLNLGEKSSGTSIMRQATGSSDSCAGVLTNYMPPATGVTGDDATNAKDCANRGDPVEDGGGGFGQSEPSGECWDTYWIILWWTMNSEGNWELDHIEMHFLYTTCDENPYPM